MKNAWLPKIPSTAGLPVLAMMVTLMTGRFCAAQSAGVALSEQGPMPGIQSFGVSPTNTPAVNKVALQRAIDWASERGVALFVEPTDEPYPV